MSPRGAEEGPKHPAYPDRNFEMGVKLSNRIKNDEAIAKFNEVVVAVPKCIEMPDQHRLAADAEKGLRRGRVTQKKALRGESEL